MNHPLILVLLIGVSVYLLVCWWRDRRSRVGGRPNPNSLPGATPARPAAVLLAATGALVLLVAETAGEIALGIDHEQTQLTRLFAIYTVAGAPVLEELIFRGWLVVERHGQRMMWASAVGASLVFALIHPFLWQSDESGFALTPGVKGWFSTLVVFAMSLWLYIARLATWNPNRSLLPCFAAHAVKNAGVVVIKAASGYIGGWW